MSSTSPGMRILVNTRGASIVDPLDSGRYFLEKLRNASSSRNMQLSSPSQSLLIAAWNSGWAKNACVFDVPIILPSVPALVCGARPMMRCPASWSLFVRL